MLTNDELRELAGAAAFTRGTAYHRDGRIALSRHDSDALEGIAEGSDTYALWLKHEGTQWRWDCDCPAADGGAFCKHLVAAVLTARDDASDQDDASRDANAAPPRRTPAAKDDLSGFLRAQPGERLAEWLLALARDDAAIDKRLRLYRASDRPTELKAALGKMLDAGGFLDYRRSISYARQLDAVVVQLDEAITRDAASARGLCEYVLGRLLKIYSRSDDSAGAIGEQLGIIARLHGRACTAAPPGKGFAKVLRALQDKDDWGLFPLEDYWDALGPEGQADYGRRLVADFAALPLAPKNEQRWTEDFGLVRLVEHYARSSGDFELLQRVLRRRLSRPHDYLRVLESLNEFGRSREALAWAEQAVRTIPDSDSLRNALADCLIAAGLDEDALEQRWQAFCHRPVMENWDALKHNADSRWPEWRGRALDHVRSRERNDASHRISLLDHDGDIDAAVSLARESPVRNDVLEHLARRLEQHQPLLAGEFHLRMAQQVLSQLQPHTYATLVSTLKRLSRSLPADQCQPLLANIRQEHRRKTKLMAMLNEAGL